jgi:hypothetical protein
LAIHISKGKNLNDTSSTKLQISEPAHTTLTHFDLVTKLNDIYYIPKNPWLQKATAIKKESEGTITRNWQ